jgi:serine/threonine-protein kinase
VNNLKLKLLGQEEERLTRRETEDLEAYNLYLKGRYFWNRRGIEDVKKSVDFFKAAIDRDPKFALACAGLADAYVVLVD